MLDPRLNLVTRDRDLWRPIPFQKPVTAVQRSVARLRRFLDLQANSIWRHLAPELPRVKGRLLDVGCGAQPYRELLSPEVSYLGIDTVDAKARFGYEIPDTLYFEGDTWPVDTGSFDVVLCTETLEHIADTLRFLDEVRRALRPGGRVILTVPFAARWHFIPHDYWRFTPSGLMRVLTQAGFTDVQVYARGNALTVACYKVEALILPFVFPQGESFVRKLAMQAIGVLLLPMFATLAVVGSLSLRLAGGDDCLGYTALARRD